MLELFIFNLKEAETLALMKKKNAKGNLLETLPCTTILPNDVDRKVLSKKLMAIPHNNLDRLPLDESDNSLTKVKILNPRII